MSFVTPEFLVLFSVVVPLYYALPYRLASPLLLAASYVFYMYWNAVYVLILLFTTICDYYLAKLIFRTSQAGRKRFYLCLSIFMNLGVLFFFKYTNFFSSSVQSMIHALGLPYHMPQVDVILPIGISFYTFQELAYTLDVYRGVLKPEDRFDIFSLFIVFFPHLIAGPIVRAPSMLPQFRVKQPFREDYVIEGLQLILWGAFKKVVIADRLAIYVNEVYGHPSQYSGPILIVATLFFAFQIYCDFSGYSDLAIGTAKVLGFQLPTNFRQPYFSRSIGEFWRRWHISLSTWFKDYVYIPLVKGQASARLRRLHIMTVFLLSGLWHGANWTFVIWGGLHGLAMLAEHLSPRRVGGSRWWPFGRLNPTLVTGIKTSLTFTFVCFAWIFFRAASLSDAWYILTHLFTEPRGWPGVGRPFGEPGELQLSVILLLILLVVDAVDARWGLNRVLDMAPRAVRWAVYYAGAIGVIWLGIWGGQEFIYFQF